MENAEFWAEILEVMMLICFGVSWPINAYKAYRGRTARSTSLAFILMILFGYFCGIAAKLVSHRINYVLIVYFLNVVTVSCNLLIYFRNRHLDRLAAAKQ